MKRNDDTKRRNDPSPIRPVSIFPQRFEKKAHGFDRGRSHRRSITCLSYTHRAVTAGSRRLNAQNATPATDGESRPKRLRQIDTPQEEFTTSRDDQNTKTRW